MEDSRMSAIAILYILKEYSDRHILYPVMLVFHYWSRYMILKSIAERFLHISNSCVILESTSRQPIGAIILLTGIWKRVRYTFCVI